MTCVDAQPTDIEFTIFSGAIGATTDGNGGVHLILDRNRSWTYTPGKTCQVAVAWANHCELRETNLDGSASRRLFTSTRGQAYQNVWNARHTRSATLVFEIGGFWTSSGGIGIFRSPASQDCRALVP